jgi:hypothetical protein
MCVIENKQQLDDTNENDLLNYNKMKFECSRDENECDKGIKWIDSCRECIFNVLCKLDKN